MARKYRKSISVMARICAVIAVLLITVWILVEGGFWSGHFVGLIELILAAMLPLALLLWALVEQFGFSFGKSRYLTRTERKRLQHQRKNKTAGKRILGRKIPDQHDR